MTFLERTRQLERALDRLFIPKNPAWWWWPAAMTATGAAVLLVSLVFGPGVGEQIELRGHAWGEPCGFYVVTGVPCPQCGMTRAWVWAARGHLWRSFVYNPAGAAMFWWLVLSGVVGAVRLLRRNKAALQLPSNVLLAWTVFWLIGLYTLPWIGRVAFQFNPLPPPIPPALTAP